MSALSAAPLAHRLTRLRDAMALAQTSQLLVTDPLNIRWLTGFTGSFASVLVGAETATLITDSRYEVQAGEQVPTGYETVIIGNEQGQRTNDLIASRITNHQLGFEADHLTVSGLETLTKGLCDALDTAPELVPVSDFIAGLRRLKDASEVERLRRAGHIADEALQATLEWIRPGESELRVARQLEWEMAERGSERPSFETILASGPNGAKPHARPSERLMEAGDLVVIDFGATVDGYGSDMTRTLAVGGKATAEQENWYQNVARSQAVGVASLVPGADLKALHESTRAVLTEAGQDGVYNHGTGHGVGLFIHENPIISPRAETAAEVGMALTVEPGAYIDGVGGVRVEDLLIVTEDGSEALTNFPKGLAVS